MKIDIISGFLGSGKTTFIKRLLGTKINEEKVVLIENEFGEANVDSDFLAESKIDIAELSQGCICCSLVGDFAKSLNEVIATYNPDRILIEPSGVGKLSDVITAITDAGLSEHLNTYICLVDAMKAKVYAKNFGEFFKDQISSAKTVILSRTDVASETKIQDAYNVVRSINSDCNIVVTPIKDLTNDDLLFAYEGNKIDMLEEINKEDEEKHHHEECGCGHHHHHDHEECECGHHHHHDHEECGCGHHHHHDHEECECGHHHHHEHEECGCGHHHHHEHEECGCGHHHHHHHAEEVFSSVGLEVVKVYDYEYIESVLHKLTYTTEYGQVVRGKGVINTTMGWKQFNITPEELEVLDSKSHIVGKVCVIGTHIDETIIKSLF